MINSTRDRLPLHRRNPRPRRSLVFTGFTHDDAWALGSLLVELARERDLPVAIDIRRGDQQLFHHARPGTVPDNAHLDRAQEQRRPALRAQLAADRPAPPRPGTTFEEATGLPRDTYAAHGGAFPIRVVDAGVIGTVTVSGLPQVDDHALVVEALRRFLGEAGR